MTPATRPFALSTSLAITYVIDLLVGSSRFPVNGRREHLLLALLT
jgi:hypothetical protein